MIFTAAEPTQNNQTWSTWWADVWNTITNYFKNNWNNVLLVFGIVVIGLIVIWLLMFIFTRIMKRTSLDPLVVRFLKGLIRLSLLLVLVLIVLRTLGVEITGFTTAISAILLAIGVALKENIANLANGFILVSSKKYKTGDYVVCGSVEGSITEINWLFTALKTPDGKQVLMPNSTMVNSQVTNFGAYPSRRVQFTLSVAYETDVELVKKVVTDVMKADGRIYLEPEPFCHLKNYGASSIDFFCHCWCDNGDYWDVYYYLMETVFNELKKHKITIPFQQIEVRQRVDEVVMPYIHDAVTPRVEKVRKKKKQTFDIDKLEEDGFKHVSDTMKDSIEQNQKNKSRRHKTANKQSNSQAKPAEKPAAEKAKTDKPVTEKQEPESTQK